MTSPRLSALDASFLAVETPTAHMHVGWVAMFSATDDGRLPSFEELRDHIDLRLGRAPRYRQKLASVPLSLHSPEWIDDPAFSIDRHVYWAPGSLGELIDEVMSIPLRRDRPLWEMWICENPAERRFAIVGKTHHCMVDGLAALELAYLLLDPTPESAPCEPQRWRAEPEPASERVLARGLRDLVSQQLDLLQWPLRMASAPGPVARQTVAGVARASRALNQLLRAAPNSVLNGELSPLRRLAWLQRPLEDVRTIKRAYGTTINDVILAAVAGGIRAYLLRRGEEPTELKVMVPVSVRSEGDVLGNHISFVFADLPCHDPDPLGRLYQVHASMSRCKREGEPEGSDLVLKAASRTPVTVQQALSRLFASPRAFNLVVSNIPGPTTPMWMLGCELQAVYPMVPLADHHAVSVGMLTVNDQACFGIYADRQALPDVDLLAQDIDDALTDMLAGTYRVVEAYGSLLQRAREAAPEGMRPAASQAPREPAPEGMRPAAAPAPREPAPEGVRPAASQVPREPVPEDIRSVPTSPGREPVPVSVSFERYAYEQELQRLAGASDVLGADAALRIRRTMSQEGDAHSAGAVEPDARDRLGLDHGAVERPVDGQPDRTGADGSVGVDW